MWRGIALLLITACFVFFLVSMKLGAQVGAIVLLAALAAAAHSVARAAWSSILFYLATAVLGVGYTFAELGARALGEESTMNAALVGGGWLAGVVLSAIVVRWLWRSDRKLLSSLNPKLGVLGACLLFAVWDAFS